MKIEDTRSLRSGGPSAVRVLSQKDDVAHRFHFFFLFLHDNDPSPDFLRTVRVSQYAVVGVGQ